MKAVLRDRRRRCAVFQGNDMNTSTNPINGSPTACWRPVAYVAMQERSAGHRIASVLERAGWVVLPQPSGFHLLQSIAGVIEGDPTWLRPGLIVIDAHARGCAGTTIAAGLRDLGITIPIVLVTGADEPRPVCSDATVRVVDRASAESVVADLAGCAIGRGHQPAA
jgi:hypothetical protein